MNRFLQNTLSQANQDYTYGYEPLPGSDEISAKISKAYQCLQEGQPHPAESTLKEVLLAETNHREALFLLGCIKLKRSDEIGAMNLLKQVTTDHKDFLHAWIVLGEAYVLAGKAEEAEQAFKQVLEINPRSDRAHLRLGVFYRNHGRLEESYHYLRYAVGLAPDRDEGHLELARTFLADHKYDEVMASCHTAILKNPSNAEAYDLLGLSLSHLGQAKNAVDSFKTAIKLNPRLADAYSHLSTAYLDMRQPAAALETAIQTARLTSDCPEAMCSRAAALRLLGRLDEATQACERALIARPDLSAALELLGLVCLDSSLPEDALKQFRKALEADPERTSAWSHVLTALRYTPDIHPEAIRLAAQEWGEEGDREPLTKPVPDTVSRIGFFCGNLGENPIGFLLEGLVDSIDRERYSLHVYINQGHQDELAQRIASKVSTFRHVVGLDDLTVAAMVEGDKVDCLVDLTGHGNGQRLGVFKHRAAPLQITWFGSNGTTGLPEMDGILVDNVLVPEHEEHYYTEHALRMTRPWVLYAPRTSFEIKPKSDGSPKTFGCFVHSKRVTRQVIRAWAQILKQVPQSKLIFATSALPSTSVQRQYIYWFRDLGIESDRLEFHFGLTHAQQMEFYNSVDVSLDPFPFTGATSVMDSLFMGVPIVAMESDGYVGRRAKSILESAGLAEFVARNEAEYVDRAVVIARDDHFLQSARENLRSQLLSSPLCDKGSMAEEFLASVARLRDWKLLFQAA